MMTNRPNIAIANMQEVACGVFDWPNYILNWPNYILNWPILKVKIKVIHIAILY